MPIRNLQTQFIQTREGRVHLVDGLLKPLDGFQVRWLGGGTDGDRTGAEVGDRDGVAERGFGGLLRLERVGDLEARCHGEAADRARCKGRDSGLDGFDCCRPAVGKEQGKSVSVS